MRFIRTYIFTIGAMGNKITARDREQIIDMCQRHEIVYAGVFGSFARGTAERESDLDLVVRFSGRKSLLDLVRIEREMSEALGRKVDLLTEAAISPHLREHIKEETVVLYGQAA